MKAEDFKAGTLRPGQVPSGVSSNLTPNFVVGQVRALAGTGRGSLYLQLWC